MNKEIIDKTIAALRHNHFEVFFAHNTAEANAIFFRDIFPGLQVETVSWGDSETMKATGVLNELRKNPELSVIDSFAPGMSRKQKIYWRRQALLTDLFLTGSNALTQKGQLVNLDMIGNRVGGITFGPKHVVLFIGINKITANLEEAMHRVRTIAAPRNAIRPEFFHRGEGIEAAAVHILNAVLLRKVGEMLLKPFAGVSEARRRGQSCTCADDHGITVL